MHLVVFLSRSIPELDNFFHAEVSILLHRISLIQSVLCSLVQSLLMLLPATLHCFHLLLLSIGKIPQLLDVRMPLFLKTEIVKFCVEASKKCFLFSIVHFVCLWLVAIDASVAEVALSDLFGA